jgi:glyoxylase-like metal-dependent hydrolase (beta-lactamase superfamily II)
MSSIALIDTNWTGRKHSIAAALLESEGHRSIVDPGPASTVGALRNGLRERGLSVADLDAILLTHIHLDHAGASGTLVRENPRLAVYVHKLGAPHMADPTKLLASAERLWPGGELMQLFGETLPVPSANLRILEGGETLTLGPRKMEVVYTPGHASHHVSYFDSSENTAFVGDTAGVRIEDAFLLLPATPPPDIDLEIWQDSLDAIAERRPERLFLTHFGYVKDPASHIEKFRIRLRDWGALAAEILRSSSDETAACDAFVAAARAEIEKSIPKDEVGTYLFSARLDLSWLGLARYCRKRAKAAS